MTGTSKPPHAQDLWQRALTARASARTLYETGDYDGAANRAYYAVFHAASAMFALEGKSFTTHNAVEGAVHRDLIRGRGWNADLGAAYAGAGNSRRIGDYGSPRHISKSEIIDILGYAERLLAEVQSRHGDNLSATHAPLFDSGQATDQ